MTSAASDRSIVEWLGGLAEPSETESFGAAHAATCPDLLDSEVYVTWARDSAFTAKMAQDYAEGDKDYNRAEFWDSVCRFLMRKAGRPIDDVPDPLTEAQYREYLERFAANLTGPEQTALRERSPEEYETWLDLQLKNVPMPSTQKPDINGFREGDRVILAEPFQGDTRHYDRYATGTLLVTDTSPAQIRVGRSTNLHEVLMDDGGLIGIDGAAFRKVGRRIGVIYSADGRTVGVKPFGHLWDS
jgi:hypothetical protein